MLTPVTDTKGTSAYLILNPAGSAATLLGSLTRAARDTLAHGALARGAREAEVGDEQKSKDG